MEVRSLNLALFSILNYVCDIVRDRRLFKQCSTMIRERQFEQVFQRLFPFADEVIRHETNCVTFFLVLGHLLVSEIKDDEKNRMYFKSLVEELLSSEDHCQSRLNIMIELFPYVPHDLKFLAFLRMMRYSFHTLQKTKFQVFQRQLPFSQIMMWMRPEDKREFFHLYSQILVAQRKMDQFVIFYMHYLKQFPEDIATLHKVLIQTIKLLNFPLMSRLSSELDSTLEPHRHPHPPSADSQTDSATEPTTATATEPQPQTPDPTVQLFDLVSSLDVNPYRRFRGRHRDLFTKWSISHKDVLSAMRNENKRIRLEEKARRREAKQKERERRRLQKQAAKQGSSPSASGSGDAETDQEMVGEESAASDSASTSTTSGNENEPELKVTVAVLSDEEEAEEAEAHSDDVEGGEDDEEDEEEGEDYEEEEEYEEGEEGEWEEYEEEEEEEDGDS